MPKISELTVKIFITDILASLFPRLNSEHTELDIFAGDCVLCPSFVLVREVSIRDFVTKELTEAAPSLTDFVNKQLLLRHQALKLIICLSVTRLTPL